MKTTTIFVTCVLVLSSMYAQNTNVKLPIIDMHVHAGQKLDNIKLLKKHNVVLAPLIAHDLDLHKKWQDSSDIEFLPALHFPGWSTENNNHGLNTFDDKDTYYPDSSWKSKKFVLPDPNWVRTKIEEGELKILGEITAQYWGMEPSDLALEPYFALAEEFDIPVGIHMALAPPGEPYRRPTFRARLGNPLLLEDLLVSHPNLRLWVMHAGHPYQEEMIALLSIYPKVYIDISAINFSRILPREAFHDYLEGLMKAGFGKRIMFGSDFTHVMDNTVEAILTASFLTEEQKRDIFYNNAARFLRLGDDEIKRHNQTN